MGTIKTCKHCGFASSAVKEFFASNGKNRYRNECKKCNNKLTAERLKAKYHENRDNYLLIKYGITEAVYNDMFKKQKGCCAICEKHQTEFNKRFAVDHCHKTGEVRALLCMNCNTGIGSLQDNSEVVFKAYKYLKEFENEGA